MTEWDLFNLNEGRKLRDQGMEKATTHADRVHTKWRDKAFVLLVEFLKTRERFMTEDVRYFAHQKKDLDTPPDSRAWGSVIMKAVKAGMIKRIGYAPMKSKNCHANPKSVWGRIT